MPVCWLNGLCGQQIDPKDDAYAAAALILASGGRVALTMSQQWQGHGVYIWLQWACKSRASGG
jgi:hypothetical protein